MRSVIVSLLVTLRATLRDRAAMQLEILALRHQLHVRGRTEGDRDRRGGLCLMTSAAFVPRPGRARPLAHDGWRPHNNPRGLPCITPRDHLPRRDPEGSRAHQIRAYQQQQLHATRPSVHESGSGRHLTEGIGFSPKAFCDGFVFHGVRARGLKFNPQALDACKTLAVFFDGGTVGQAGSMRQTD